MMKTIALFAFLTLGSLSLNAFESWVRLSFKPDIHGKRFPVYPRSPFSRMNLGSELLMIPRHATFSMQTLRVEANFRKYTTEFDEGAIFCRMENQCLRRYNFKFSIHAGGYRE